MTATIGLEDVRFHASHGFYEEEHLTGNEFSIDVEVEANILGAATQDDLGGTVNYSTIYYLLQAEMKKPTQLLEALAYRMARRIQQQFDGVSSVRLRLRKLHPPLGGQVGAAVVEVRLGSGSSLPPAASPQAPTNKVVFDEDAYPETGGGFPFSNFQGSSDTFEDDDDFDEDDFDEDGFEEGDFEEGDFDEDDEEYYDDED